MPALRNHKRNRNSFDGVLILNTFQERLKEKQEINSYISLAFGKLLREIFVVSTKVLSGKLARA